jgi:signal transduction histidine kinase
MYSTKTFGVGLGVPIIKNVLESHGGGVEYHSEVGKGTTVVMWLPLLADAC